MSPAQHLFSTKLKLNVIDFQKAVVLQNVVHNIKYKLTALQSETYIFNIFQCGVSVTHHKDFGLLS
jgi:hypothetical protein